MRATTRFGLCALLLALIPAAPAWAVPVAAGCSYTLGFQAFHDLIPELIGPCLSNETHSPENGDAIQQTANGLLVWRKADNWTAFTDGTYTWLNGPNSLQQRLNGERFHWEGDFGKLFAPFVGNWGLHGFSLSIQPTGEAVAIYRTYRWCGPGVPQPCDSLQGNEIVSGGRDRYVFTKTDGSATQGLLLDSTDPATVAGPAVLVLQPYGMGVLSSLNGDLTLCGPHLGEGAPPGFLQSAPCGA